MSDALIYTARVMSCYGTYSMSTFTRKMGDLVMCMFKTHEKCACKLEILASASKDVFTM